MKTEIKNFLKSNLLGFISLILILAGGAYAKTWTSGSVVTASDFQLLRDLTFNTYKLGTDENGNFTCPSGRAMYTTHRGGPRIIKNIGTGVKTCNSNTFGINYDPWYGVVKTCMCLQR